MTQLTLNFEPEQEDGKGVCRIEITMRKEYKEPTTPEEWEKATKDEQLLNFTNLRNKCSDPITKAKLNRIISTIETY